MEARLPTPHQAGQILAAYRGQMNAGKGNRGSHLEGLIEAGFQAYFDARIAWLDRMPIKVRAIQCRASPSGVHWLSAGKGPFDVYGWTLAAYTQKGGTSGRFVGCELKEAREMGTSLPIIAPGKDGTGLQFHQLDALASLAGTNGIAKVVWDNGGAYGVLDEAQILLAHQTYMKSMTSRQPPPPGVKSIKWELFRPIDFRKVDTGVVLDWLEPSDEVGPARASGDRAA